MIKNIKNPEMPWKNKAIYEDEMVHDSTEKMKKIDIRQQSELWSNRIDATNRK